jgi:hypothetical protein
LYVTFSSFTVVLMLLVGCVISPFFSSRSFLLTACRALADQCLVFSLNFYFLCVCVCSLFSHSLHSFHLSHSLRFLTLFQSASQCTLDNRLFSLCSLSSHCFHSLRSSLFSLSLLSSHFFHRYDKKIGGDTLFVNDPGFNRASYSYSNDVVGWRLYNMTMSNLKK